MKGTEHFKKVIQEYLEDRAINDSLFAEQYHKSNKNIDDCIIYILNTVQKSGCNGFADDEIFGMAVHFYDEDDIQIGKPMNNTHIVVNHFVELTEEEKKQAHQDAIQKAQDEAYRKATQPKKAKKVVLNPQPSLFDF